ncbi:MAG: GNAT family protein [Patescibacteria group bacterium]|nr:GNAT family protein [Patescibacteria group bacterium]MDD5715396.1 GNAT family protein [Patescibacteria group bacterium]
MKYVIKTKRFTLRPFVKADAQALARNINDYRIYRYTLHIPFPYSIRHAHRWLTKVTKRYVLKRPASIPFAIDIAGEAAGCVDIMNIEQGDRAEIGYWLARRFWGRGITTRAVKLVGAFAFKQFKLKKLYAYTFVRNKASMAVLTKNGFIKQALLREHIKKAGGWVDEYVWEKQRP